MHFEEVTGITAMSHRMSSCAVRRGRKALAPPPFLSSSPTHYFCAPPQNPRWPAMAPSLPDSSLLLLLCLQQQQQLFLLLLLLLRLLLQLQ